MPRVWSLKPNLDEMPKLQVSKNILLKNLNYDKFFLSSFNVFLKIIFSKL